MPELPEVETVRRGLISQVLGATVADVAVRHPRAVRRQAGGSDQLRNGLQGRSIEGVQRRGKYLWLTLDEPNSALVAHLGMSGQFRVVSPGGVDAVESSNGNSVGALPKKLTDPAMGESPNTSRGAGLGPLTGVSSSQVDDPHVRVEFLLTDGRTLRFRDQRTFGWVLMDSLGRPGAAGRPRLPESVAHVAPDPFESDFDPDSVAAKMARSQAGIKRMLLDQKLVSGVGNIYADEALWRARVNAETRGSDLGVSGTRDLLDRTVEVLSAALEAGGTSFDALYVNVNGESGWFERSLHAYGRESDPCSRCGTAIVRERFANRSSFFCPDCQPKPRTVS